MKRWELQELKRAAEVFSKSFCSEVYDYFYLSKDSDLLEKWNSKVFKISISENKGIVEINLKDWEELSYCDTVSIATLSKAIKGSDGWHYKLKDFIQYFNELRVVPDSIYIEFSNGKVTKLVADGVTYIEFKPFLF